MSNTTISIAIPESMRAYVSGRVESNDYGNMSEYFRELVRKDQMEQAKTRLRTCIEEGLCSGAAQASTAPDQQELQSIARGDTA
jgi:antitoxin ParD1/3/4